MNSEPDTNPRSATDTIVPLFPVPVPPLDWVTPIPIEAALENVTPIEHLEHLAMHVAMLTAIVRNLSIELLSIREGLNASSPRPGSGAGASPMLANTGEHQ